MMASPADAADPRTTAVSPSRASRGSDTPSPRALDPTLSTSAAATPSGYGRSEFVTRARRSGIVKSTPITPPLTQMRNDCQNGNPVHQPTITSPGSTKMMADSVPAADATVCTMLFSRIEESFTALRMAIEMTAAGIDEANVSPTLSPRYTFAAVKRVVMSAPSTRPRSVSSLGFTVVGLRVPDDGGREAVGVTNDTLDRCGARAALLSPDRLPDARSLRSSAR